MKKSELIKEIKQLNKCLTDKDDRITRIEERWDSFIGCLIIISIVGLITGYATGCIFMNIYLLDIGMNQITSIIIATIEIVFPVVFGLTILFLYILLMEN